MFKDNKIPLEELQKGSEKAYALLYDLYYENLVRYCFNLTGDLSQAEDIVQSVFIKIWASRKKINIATSLKSYLYRATFNNFVKELDKKKRREKTLLELKNEVLTDLADMDNDILEEKIKHLNRAIDKLPKKCKKVFLLNKKHGYRYKEIALELNLSEKTVEKHISRAIYRIKRTLRHSAPGIFLLFFRKFRACFETCY